MYRSFAETLKIIFCFYPLFISGSAPLGLRNQTQFVFVTVNPTTFKFSSKLEHLYTVQTPGTAKFGIHVLALGNTVTQSPNRDI